MDKIIDLRQKRAKAWEDAKAFLNTHADENGLLNAEDESTYDKMEADITKLGAQIDRLERQKALDLELSMPVSKPITEKPASAKKDEKTGFASDEYKKSFWDFMRTSPASITPALKNALQIGTDTEGGYLVPDEFENKLIEALNEQSVFRSIATVIKTASGERKIPLVTSYGQAAWTDEEQLITDSDDTFGQVSLGAHKLATLVKVSDELLYDSAFDLESFIAAQFARRISEKEETAFITGDGSSKPTGILNATNGAQVGITAASATAITSDELIDLYYSLKKPYRKNATFLTNDATVKAIRKLKDSNGQYLWQPSIAGGTPDKLLDCNLVTSFAMPTAAAGTKTIAFGDFSYYWIADRQNRIFKKLSELYAANGQVGFIGTQRVDGKLILPEAIKVLQMKGTAAAG